MRDILVSMSLGTMPLSLYCVYLVIALIMTKLIDNDRELSEFRWGMVCACSSFAISCLLYILWDFDLITKKMQYDLSIIPRVFMFSSVVLFFRTLSLRFDNKYRAAIIAASLGFMVLVYVLRVLFW